MKGLKQWLVDRWLIVVTTVAAALFIVFLYTFRLGSLTGGGSSIEASYLQNAHYISNIFHGPAFLLHKQLTFLALALPFDSFGLLRLPAALMMVTFIGCFYLLVHRWYTTRVALLTTLLFATSSWTLTIGRQALPTVSYLAWLPILALVYWSVSKGKNALILPFWVLGFGWSLYIPGILWFVLVMAASQRKRLAMIVRTLPKWQVGLNATALLLLALPYSLQLFQHPLTALANLGLPTTLQQVIHFPELAYRLVLQLFLFAGNNPVFHLGHLPYIDIASTALFLLGLYRLRYSKAQKMMKWSGIIIAGWVVGAGFGAINIAIFLPLIYIVMGGGISFLLVQWFTVFPKNPIARSAGVALVSALVVLISAYHLDRYFIAWPLSPATRAVFSAQTVVK